MQSKFPSECYIYFLKVFYQQFISAKSAPGGVSLLPGLRLQEGDLRDVRSQGAEHQGLQTELHLMPGTGEDSDLIMMSSE